MRTLRTLAAVALLALPLSLAACDEKPAPEPAWALPAAVRDLPAGPLGDITPPPTLIAWGGVADME
jgi:hypothetical protein